MAIFEAEQGKDGGWGGWLVNPGHARERVHHRKLNNFFIMLEQLFLYLEKTFHKKLIQIYSSVVLF